MGITIYSPYSGRPVQIRDQDVGRAVRDEQNRIFYVLPRADGGGYYAALTRKGGLRDEKRYDDLRTTAASTSNDQPTHNAAGRRRRSIRGKLVIGFLALIVGVLTYLFTFGPFSWNNFQRGQTPPPNPIVLPPARSTPVDPNRRAPVERPEIDPADLDEQSRRGHAGAVEPGTASQSAVIPKAMLRRKPTAPTPAVPVEVNRTPGTPGNPGAPEIDAAPTRLQHDIEIDILSPGDANQVAGAGDTVVMHYHAYLSDGVLFDSTSQREQPFTFVLGDHQVIPGLAKGVAGMTLGERRRIVIPPNLAYAKRGVTGLIPPDETLRYEIELVELVRDSERLSKP